MKALILSAFIVGASLMASSAMAQEAKVTVEPKFGNGALEGCQLTFDVTFRDYGYDSGRWVQGSGSFVLYSFPERGVGMMLKLGIAPLEPRDAPVISPTTAYFINGLRTNADETLSNMESETPGYRLIMFRGGDQTLISIVGMENGGLDIGYTRDGGRQAQQFHVPIDEQQAANWTECQTVLLGGDE